MPGASSAAACAARSGSTARPATAARPTAAATGGGSWQAQREAAQGSDNTVGGVARRHGVVAGLGDEVQHALQVVLRRPVRRIEAQRGAEVALGQLGRLRLVG